MTGTTQARSSKTTALLLALMLMVSVFGVFSQTLPQGMPAPQDSALNAAVVIKTQKAADSLIGNGAIKGIDVSKYQGTINWQKVAANNDIDFVFVRSSYGTTPDPMFVTNATEAHANGLKVGAYHFATFRSTAQMQQEAEYFLNRLRQVDITYPVVLDLEGESHKRIKKSSLTKLATDFMDIISAEGYTVMLYSYNNFIHNHLDLNRLEGYNLWVANYMEQPSTINHQLWQHTSYGTVSGIKGRVDINIAYADLMTGATRTPSRDSDRGNAAASNAVVPVKVNKTVSDSIKVVLNDRYAVGLPLEGLDMQNMNRAIATGLQYEVNRQWDLNLPVDGQMTREQVNTIASAGFKSTTQGNITYLIQAKLFYKGFYTGELTGVFDDNTVAAVRAYQQDRGMEADGKLDAPTLHRLLL